MDKLHKNPKPFDAEQRAAIALLEKAVTVCAQNDLVLYKSNNGGIKIILRDEWDAAGRGEDEETYLEEIEGRRIGSPFKPDTVLHNLRVALDTD